MSRPSNSTVILAAGCLVFGAAIGTVLRPDGIRSAVFQFSHDSHPENDDRAEHDAHSHDDHTGGEHVDVSETARKSIGLSVAQVSLRDYVGTTRIPAHIIEQSAVSDMLVASQVEGIVTAVHALTGEAVREGQTLFTIRLSGDALTAAQSDLLATSQQIAIVDEEIARLAPLTKSGAVSGATKLERDYERRRLLARQDTKQQELLVRGLSQEQIDRIINSGQLVTTVDVAVPAGLVPTLEEGTSTAADPWNFTIEALRVTPGALVKVGDPLCDLAYHAELYVAGQAFARDLRRLEDLMIARRPVSAEFDDSDNPSRVDGLVMSYIDNHVDPEFGTYGFYLPIRNEVVHDSVDKSGRRFRQWRFKPGARGHVLLPTSMFSAHIVLPREAVVADGLESYVFVEQHEDDYHGDHDHSHEHDHEEGTIEFIPVPVNVVYEDRHVKVISTDGQLKQGDEVAMNHAHTLLMAMRVSDDAGHHHHHDH